MQKTTNVFPTLGARKIEHIKNNLEALEITLSQQQIDFLEQAIPFDVGFPTNFVVSRLFLSAQSVCS